MTSQRCSVREFKLKFIDEWCKANKQKPRGIDSNDSEFGNYLLPIFAERRLDSLLLKQKGRPKFYDFDQYEWLVEAAAKEDARILLLVLLAGDAGLRRGEIVALQQSDVDLRRGQLTIQRSEWKGKVTTEGFSNRKFAN